MRTSDVASAYARSLFDLATLADSVDATDAGMTTAVSAVRGDVALREVLTDTSVPVEAKRAILREIFGEQVTPEALGIVTLLAERGRTALLGEVAREFSAIAERERGIVVARVTTAVPLDDAQRTALSDRLAATLGHPVSLRETVDARVLAGIVIEVAGRVLDGSVATQLDDVRRALATVSGGEE
jgi:F-type H+-transporting ATPase subunit delta